MVFLSPSRASQRKSPGPARGSWEQRATVAALPDPAAPGWEGLGQAGAAGRLPLRWPLRMAPAESFEVARKEITKARNEGTQVFPLPSFLGLS